MASVSFRSNLRLRKALHRGFELIEQDEDGPGKPTGEEIRAAHTEIDAAWTACAEADLVFKEELAVWQNLRARDPLTGRRLAAQGAA